MKIFLSLITLFSLFILNGQELLSKRNWTANPAGSKGRAVKNSDGSWSVIKDDDKGAMVFAFHGGPYKLAPGKQYLIEWEVLAPENQTVGTMSYLPRKPKPRTPWPSGGSITGSGKWQKVTQLLQLEEGEDRANFYLTLRGKPGKTTVRSCKVSEVKGMELISNLNWTANVSNTVATARKSSSGIWEVEKKDDRGFAVFTHHGAPVKLTSGKYYLIEWEILADAGQSLGSMVYLPRKPKPRSPWPTGKTVSGSGKWDKARQFLAVEKGESGGRIQLVISGNAGKTMIKSCTVTEITKEEYQRALAPKLVEKKVFNGKELKKDWEVFSIRKHLPGGKREGLYFDAYGRSGIICRRLNWRASDVKIIELSVSSDQPAVFRMDFTVDDNGKRRTGYLNYVTYADGKLHNLRFEAGDNPSWRGIVKEIKFTCIADGGKVGIERLAARKEDNLIPFVEDRLPEYKIENIRPRGRYLLKNAAGATLSIFDRDGKVIFKTAGDRKDVEFTAPVMTVTAKITNAPANASLTLLHLKPMELPEIYWRGSWIWCQNGFGPNNTNVWFSKTIDLKSAAQAAQAVMTADDNLEFFINGKKVGDGRDHWASCTRFDIAKFLKPGKNDIVVKAHNVSAWGGFIGEIYIRENGVDRFYPTGKDWLCHIGGDAMPQKFTTPAFLLGPPPAPPWGTRTGYLYIGPKSRLELVNAGKNSFTVKVLDKVPADLAKLTFKTVDAEGKEKTVEGIITPSTGKWQPGKTVKVSFRLPGTADQDLKIRMASDVMEVKGDPVIATVAKVQAKKIPAPVTARIVGSGKRSWIEINGEKFNPIYYDGYKSPEKDWMLRDAVAGGCRIVRTGIGFDTIWAKPDKLDFTELDKLMDSFALNAPEVKVILQVKLAMPQWWCDANPDEVVRYDRDQPIRPYQDRQALASRRWLKEASVILRKLIRHILRSPYADRIFAIGLSEGWNSEWFWTYSDRFNQSAYSGYSFADYATFAAYLKERYKTNEAFAKAWNTPGLTFDNFTIPPRKELDRASVITLLDPVRDRKIIDWYIFRNRSIGEAIEAFAKVVKEETQNRWLTGVYYGYFKMFSGIYHRLQSVGHLDVERLSRSPYVDIFWAPSDYNMRRPGLPDGIMQAAENLTSHGKLVVVEQDMRTFCENDHYEAGRMRTVELTVGAFERAFGLLLSRGVATHWLAMHESWFREKVLLDLMKHQQEVYASLPPVKGSVPADVCIVSDTASAFYTMHNLGNNLHRATVYQLVSNFNFTGTSFRHLFVKDLNEPGLIPPHKLYIMTNILAISDADRAKLMERFEREKATVLWLYAAGISTPDQGPSAQLMSRFLGINVTMDKRVDVPEMRLIPEAGGGVERNFMQSGPWFIAQSGFDKVLGRDKNGRPLLVKWQKGNVTHFFSTIMSLSSDLLRKIAGFSGAHIYNENTGDPLLAGNDVIFLHAGSGGKKVIKLPAGCKARAISGPIKGEFTGNITFEAVIGRTYGFHISK